MEIGKNHKYLKTTSYGHEEGPRINLILARDSGHIISYKLSCTSDTKLLPGGQNKNHLSFN